MVRPYRTFSVSLHRYRGNKECRCLCHLFGVVIPNLLTYIVQGKQGVQGAYALVRGGSSIPPHRTFSNHIITEIARCLEFCHMSSGWFDCTEHSLSTSLQGKQGVKGAYALVRGGSSKVCRVLSHEFGVVRLYRTFSIYIVTGETRHAGCLCTSLRGCYRGSNHRSLQEIAKCVEFCRMSSGWFHCTEPSLSHTGETCRVLMHLFGVVPEPHHYRDSKLCRVLSHEFGVVRPYRTFSVYIVTGETRSARC